MSYFDDLVNDQLSIVWSLMGDKAQLLNGETTTEFDCMLTPLQKGDAKELVNGGIRQARETFNVYTSIPLKRFDVITFKGETFTIVSLKDSPFCQRLTNGFYKTYATKNGATT